jgi:hypothetical protein
MQRAQTPTEKAKGRSARSKTPLDRPRSFRDDTIIDRLSDAGVQAGWMQPPDGPADWNKPLLSVAAAAGGNLRYGLMNPEAIAGLMLEFIDLDAWCHQVALTVSAGVGDGVPVGVRPWPCFSDESRTWA